MTNANYEQTSKEAFDKVKEVQVPIKARVLQLISESTYGFTRSELVSSIGGPDETIQPALSHLVAAGKVRKNGETRPNPRGNNENVYVLGDGRAGMDNLVLIRDAQQKALDKLERSNNQRLDNIKQQLRFQIVELNSLIKDGIKI